MAPRRSALDYARELASFGFNVIPAKAGGKAPIVDWKKYATEPAGDKQLSLWFGGARPVNYWIPCGQVSRCVVLDGDSAEAETFWRNELGELLDRTTCVRTSKGHHWYFRLEPGDVIASWSHHDAATGLSFDVRAEGTGVIVPPSVHESGHVYEWVRGPEAMEPVPAALRGPGRTNEDLGGGGSTKGSGSPRSMLAELLSKPAAEGGRNDWLARVAGHYAKHFRNMEDAYRVQCVMANDMLASPLDEAEFEKTIASIWSKEQEKDEQTALGPDNGWLMAGDSVLMVQVRVKRGEEYSLDLAEYADFDIRALGVVEDDEANRVYDVVVRRKRQGDERAGLLPASDLSDSRRLRGWLAEFGVSVIVPDNVWPKAGGPPERLQRYIEAQDPPHFRVVEHLGWHVDGFVCHEGVIRADGLHGFERLKPHSKLAEWAPYHYGFGDREQAQEVLREVLTFHDPTVCAVYGAWWAACFLKSHIHNVSSQFPFMALEAPSESGKTTGFFSLMMALNGNANSQNNPTMASLRDYLSGNQAGIVWIDDLSKIEHLMDLLRQATGEGSVSKKGQDRFSQEIVRLVAPICISGEALQLGGQKALVDRAIQLEVPSPTDRRSKHDSSRMQWLDIVALRDREPNLCRFSGTLLSSALQHADLVAEIPSLVPEPGGRWGDKIAIVRMGARLLAEMAGAGAEWVIETADAWCADQESTGNENTLTLKLLPMALRQLNWPNHPEAADGRWPATPVFIDGSTVWFSPVHLAAWWKEMNHGHIEMRTESEEALTQQARALGLGGDMERGRKTSNRRGPNRRRWDLSRDRNRKSIYWRLSDELASLVLSRSRGGGLSRGVHPVQQRLALWASTEPGHLDDLV